MLSIEEITQVTLANRDPLMEQRMMDSYNAFRRMMGEPKKLTRSEKVKRRVQIYRDRVWEAWQVLLGRADIRYD